MSPPDRIAELLITHEAYRVCHLLPSREFVQFCRDRNIIVNEERLRKLERLGLFFPVLRIYRIDTVSKVEYVEGGKRFRPLGPLREGEIWTGDTRTELAQFDFSSRVVRSWQEHGNAWDPRADVSPHTGTIDGQPNRHEAFYSQFQIADLDNLISMLTPTVEVEWALQDDGAISPSWGDSLKPNLSLIAADVVRSKLAADQDMIAPLCQYISDRYYPKTQTDERHITLSEGGLHHGKWDWYEHARSWDAPAAVALFDLNAESLRRLYERTAGSSSHGDPLQQWQQLVRFVSVAKRKKLRGDALKAQTLGEMAKILRLLYRDAYGALPEAESGSTFFRIPDINPEDDPSRALELTANDFGVNPKPQLVLFVEGATETTAIPLIFDKMYAALPNVFGIELINLQGISNATGGRDNPFSALWRLIDYLHHHQTISFVLLDNEGLASRNVAKGLPRAHSIHFPDRRATRPNYVKLWKLSFELDNFSDAELALTLSSYSEGKAVFTAADVKQCRQSARSASKNKKIRTLDVLYTERTGRNINKPLFGRLLVQLMFAPETRRKAANRPITRFLVKVADAAALNHQPTTHAMWEYNQRTGYLGTLRPGAVSRRKKPFGEPTRKRRSAKNKV